jgi:hypothetical protein
MNRFEGCEPMVISWSSVHSPLSLMYITELVLNSPKAKPKPPSSRLPTGSLRFQENGHRRMRACYRSCLRRRRR